MKRLKNHKIVAWDLDETLFQHKKSREFARFVEANPWNQEFHIVTFRSHGMEREIEADLKSLGLTPDHFQTINSAPYRLVEANHTARTTEHLPQSQRIMNAFKQWKGRTCAAIGATVLIDDLTFLVEVGCEKHKIDLFHPDDLDPQDIEVAA